MSNTTAVQLMLLQLHDEEATDPGAPHQLLLQETTTDVMDTYTRARCIARDTARQAGVADDVIDRFLGRMARVVDQPAPTGDESRVYLVINKPSRLMWSAVWPDPATGEFTHPIPPR